MRRVRLAREHEVARPLGHRDRGGVDHRLRNPGHHRCVDDAQTRDALDAQRGVHDRTEAARSDRVMERFAARNTKSRRPAMLRPAGTGVNLPRPPVGERSGGPELPGEGDALGEQIEIGGLGR